MSHRACLRQMVANDFLLTALFWVVAAGSSASFLVASWRGKRVRFIGFAWLIFITLCFAAYELRLPATYAIRVDLLLLLPLLAAAWMRFVFTQGRSPR